MALENNKFSAKLTCTPNKNKKKKKEKRSYSSTYCILKI